MSHSAFGELVSAVRKDTMAPAPRAAWNGKTDANGMLRFNLQYYKGKLKLVEDWEDQDR